VRDFVCLQNLVPQANAERRLFLKAMLSESQTAGIFQNSAERDSSAARYIVNLCLPIIQA
jgi:hypothetical protein